MIDESTRRFAIANQFTDDPFPFLLDVLLDDLAVVRTRDGIWGACLLRAPDYRGRTGRAGHAATFAPAATPTTANAKVVVPDDRMLAAAGRDRPTGCSDPDRTADRLAGGPRRTAVQTLLRRLTFRAMVTHATRSGPPE
jgi:hypothetical protein